MTWISKLNAITCNAKRVQHQGLQWNYFCKNCKPTSCYVGCEVFLTNKRMTGATDYQPCNSIRWRLCEQWAGYPSVWGGYKQAYILRCHITDPPLFPASGICASCRSWVSFTFHSCSLQKWRGWIHANNNRWSCRNRPRCRWWNKYSIQSFFSRVRSCRHWNFQTNQNRSRYKTNSYQQGTCYSSSLLLDSRCLRGCTFSSRNLCLTSNSLLHRLKRHWKHGDRGW